MIVNEDAQLLATAVRDRGLQLLSLPNAEAVARRLPFKRVGRIVAGQYDPVRVLPSEAKDVLQVDTLIVGNGCARRSATQGFITVVVAVFPDFVRYNHDTPNRTGLPLAPAAASYFEHEGPDIVGVYAPWVFDIMPTASWVQLILGISLLLNAKSLWNRFHLSRIDADRMRTEDAIPLLFGRAVTVAEIAEMTPSEKHRTPEARTQLDAIVDQLAALLERSRRASSPCLCPRVRKCNTTTRRSSSATSCMPSAIFVTAWGLKRGCRQSTSRPLSQRPRANRGGARPGRGQYPRRSGEHWATGTGAAASRAADCRRQGA